MGKLLLGGDPGDLSAEVSGNVPKHHIRAGADRWVCQNASILLCHVVDHNVSISLLT